VPIYEYRCKECGHEVEVIQPAGREAKPRCDECGGAMKRLISATSFILKGEGWYVTDYPSKDRKAAMDAEKKVRDKKKEKAGGKGKPASPSPTSAKKERKSRPPRKT